MDAASLPLAARLRPRTLDEFAGQKHLLGEGKVLRRIIESDKVGSMIFWGPPGVGKDDARAYHRKPHAREVHRLFRRDERHQGDYGRSWNSGAQPPLR